MLIHTISRSISPGMGFVYLMFRQTHTIGSVDSVDTIDSVGTVDIVGMNGCEQKICSEGTVGYAGTL